MGNKRDVVVLVGSLRKDSLNRKLAAVLPELAPEELALEVVEIGDLAIYNQDLEGEVPPAWARFRARIRKADAILFVTPEYNRSIPGGLKNAIDVASRPPKESAWRGKPAAVITATPGRLGGFGANHHLRQAVVSLDVAMMPAPEAYIGGANDLFDDAGHLISPDVRSILTHFTATFARWITRHLPA